MATLPALPRKYHAASIWLLYAIGLLPAAYGFWLGATGRLPGNPVKEFEHLLGLWALRFLVATLAITPLRDLTGINWIRYRRALGLLAFWYVLMHLLTYMVLDQYLNVAAILADIAKRPFITIGMAAFLMLVPLALTSNGWSIRRLGPRWVKLHRLVYLIAAAGALHFAMSVKVVGLEPWSYIALVVLLLAYRLIRPMTRRKKRGRPDGAASLQGSARSA
ncbi:protein-methionine-sulfoxide reductase heme-binding subunit MsrQ [Shinella zoogloeoides]|uniref:Protein-methionine-sulfoxide reductase heme-binding subunit MsrQ n=1 Tax=Shinella zoogloeoides TaxID=352475 RepID=A0A6N8TDQ1_SHIZO|nr:protein-methionine-sulfoxide reductase heme-binding subunit MsrQ [Shinella zoogloeoides]MXN99229.1 protein-methionine-sulfoxide reductase heme-binding subunit MsrQ [Shinella zoogloeoides]UEX82987.1 protein-methionine-sulfoxide reductase heme-binding subunit MsrQ [Shinella zoogloeoides]